VFFGIQVIPAAVSPEENPEPSQFEDSGTLPVGRAPSVTMGNHRACHPPAFIVLRSRNPNRKKTQPRKGLPPARRYIGKRAGGTPALQTAMATTTAR
jgi:hypothetical protein